MINSGVLYFFESFIISVDMPSKKTPIMKSGLVGDSMTSLKD